MEMFNTHSIDIKKYFKTRKTQQDLTLLGFFAYVHSCIDQISYKIKLKKYLLKLKKVVT